MNRVDFGGAIFSEATDELVGTSYEDERTRVYFRDKAWEADYKLLQGKFPGKDIDLGSSTADDRVVLVTASSDTDPGERYLFDRTTKKLTLQYKVRERIPREHMAEMKAVRYPSSDGLEIPAFLTLPKGVPAKDLPAIVVAARRPLGPRRLGLQQPRPVPRQPRLRGPAAQLPRLHRLRQEVPERRQQAVGRQDAGRRHLGRQVPRRPGHRRPEARRDHGRLLRRLRDARRRRLHARPLRGGGGHRRPLEPHHAARLDPALLGGGPDHLPRAHGQPDDARGQGPARAAVAAQLRRRRSRPRSSWPRAPTTRASRRPSPSRS